MKDILDELKDGNIGDLAELFKVFGDYTRLRILFALVDREMAVGEIAEKLGMSQSAVSHQLSVLKMSKLITGRREGKSVIYSLADDHVSSIISQGLEHVME